MRYFMQEVLLKRKRNDVKTHNDLDRERVCVECGEQWYFSEEFEQKLKRIFGQDYNEPKRCAVCRNRRNAQKRFERQF